MPVESVEFIDDLNASNPVGATDPKSQGDDHIRNIKLAIKNTFPNIDGAVTATQANLNVLAGTTNDRVVRVTGGAANLGQLTAGMFPNTVVPDAALSSNVPLKDTQAIFTGTGTGSQAIAISNAIPRMSFIETDQAADNQVWYITGNGGALALSAVNDARSVVTNGLRFVRSGTTLTTCEIAATNITLNSVNVTDYARKSQANVFTAGNQDLVNASGISLRLAVGTAGTNSFDLQQLTSTSVAEVVQRANAALNLYTNGTLRLQITSGGNFDFKSGTVTTDNASASEVGFKGIPRNVQSDNYTMVLSDAGKNVVESGTSKTITIPANASVAFPPGTAILITAEGSNAASIAITSDTLYLAGTAFATTGTRTLARGGMAFLFKLANTEWMISGPGVT